jgi:hypothetical protein
MKLEDWPGIDGCYSLLKYQVTINSIGASNSYTPRAVWMVPRTLDAQFSLSLLLVPAKGWTYSTVATWKSIKKSLHETGSI